MRIALMGSAPSSVQLGPYYDKSYRDFLGGRPNPAYPPSKWIDDAYEIWGCSPGLFGVAPRVTRWFELHRWEPGQAWFSPEYCQFLRDFRGPVYTGGPVPEIHNHVIYPLAQVEAEFTAFFLTSSLSLMAAIAIQVIEQIRLARRGQAALPPGIPAEELTKSDDDDVIGFWGVDMSANEEYARQKPGCWYFGLEIIRRGIGLYYPPESDLFCPEPIYGLAEWDHNYIKATARSREINQRRADAQQRIEKARDELMAMSGAIDDFNYVIKTWMTPYSLPAGQVLRKLPGTGLGVTMPEVQPSGAVDMGAIPYTGRVNAG